MLFLSCLIALRCSSLGKTPHNLLSTEFELNTSARASFRALCLLIQRILRVFFFWTLLAKSAPLLLEEKEFFPFQGKSLNPRKLGLREIFNCHFILLRLYTWVGDFIDEIIGPSCSHQLGIALITLAYDQMMFSSCADDEKTCSFFYVSLGDNLNIVLLYNC